MGVQTQEPLASVGLNLLVKPPSGLERAALVLVFMVLVLARLPNVALHGRVWAEEGAAFMRNAIVLPWPEAIFHPVGGYLNLVANLAGLVAGRMVAPEQARWVGVLTGLAFQTLPAILIVTSPLRWLQSRISLIAALLLIATVPLAEEVWLNSLHPQFHLTLCTALLLGMKPGRRWAGMAGLAIILLAALCGPTAWFLLPLFVGRAVLDRSCPRGVQAATLAVGVLLQVLFFFNTGDMPPTAFDLGATISAFFCKNLLIPTLDFRTAAALGAGLYGMATHGTVPIVLGVAECACVVAGGVALWMRHRTDLFWMFAAAVLIAALSYAAARGGVINLTVLGSGNRYAFVPQVLFALVLLGVAVTDKGAVVWLARGGVLWLLIIGSAEFHDDSLHGTFDRGPGWTAEVAAWRRDPNHLVLAWPGEPWQFDLNPPVSAAR